MLKEKTDPRGFAGNLRFAIGDSTKDLFGESRVDTECWALVCLGRLAMFEALFAKDLTNGC